jgi:hypothetical protein
VRWTGEDGAPLSDLEVTDLMIGHLNGQLVSLDAAPLRTIVLITHHLPFRSLVPPVFVDGRLKFFRAFLGSQRIGEAARANSRVSLALAGHIHSTRTAQEGRIVARTCPVGYPRERREGDLEQDRRMLLEV